MFSTVMICFCAASSVDQGTVSHAETRAYPVISTLIACRNASGDVLESGNFFLAGPAKSSVKFLLNWTGSEWKSRPSITLVTFDRGDKFRGLSRMRSDQDF